MDARQTARRILEAGKSDELTAGLLAIAEMTAPGGGGRYAPRVCRELARIIVCRNYAKSVLQLCHLVNAADACAPRNESYERFLFGVPAATPRCFRDHLSHLLANRDWRRPGFEIDETGIVIRYRDGGRFGIACSRMPLLAALMEFVIGIDGYAAVDDTFGVMLADSTREAAVGAAANTLSRRLYGYLSDHLPTVQNMSKFNRILEFLRERSGGGEVEIGDEAILAFWLDQSVRGPSDETGFRTYRAVFDAIVAFIRSLELAGDRPDPRKAVPIGGDRDSGEVDPDTLADLLEDHERWQSPLSILEDLPASRVKFLTGREKDGLRLLLDLGPLARALPLSVLRAEIFGSVQARLTQALRRRVAAAGVQLLLEPGDSEDYRARRDTLRVQHDRTVTVMKAALYVLLRDRIEDEGDNIAVLTERDPETLFARISDGPAPALPAGVGRVMEEAAKAFRDISRQGFSDDDIGDPSIIEAFRFGAGALHTVAAAVENFLETLSGLDSGSPDLSGLFQRDRETFRTQFQRMYGVER